MIPRQMVPPSAADQTQTQVYKDIQQKLETSHVIYSTKWNFFMFLKTIRGRSSDKMTAIIGNGLMYLIV